MSEPLKSFNFLDFLKAIGTRWYWLVIAMIAGGLLGWGATSFKHPLYEADAVFTVTIDYTRTGALSDVEEDQAMRGVGDIIFSDEVVSDALAVLKNQGMTLSRDEFFDDAVFDREEFRWAIRYRDADAETALRVVNAWQGEADRILQDSLVHARKAASYEKVLNGLELCLQRGTQASELEGECSLGNLDAILGSISSTSDLINKELSQSRGLFSALTVVLSDPAQLPTQAVRYQTNVQVLCGMAIGLLAAILALAIHYQSRQKTRHG